jgi:hypothetical protein
MKETVTNTEAGKMKKEKQKEHLLATKVPHISFSADSRKIYFVQLFMELREDRLCEIGIFG